MDREDYFRSTTGRALYAAFLDAIRQGATIEELEIFSKESLAKAYRTMDGVGIAN